MITLSKLAKLANVSVSTESYEICRLAADSVIKRIGGDYSGKSVTVPAKLKFRKSFEV